MIIGHHKVAWFDVALCSEWMKNRGYATTLKRAQALHSSGSIFDLRKGGSLPAMLLATSYMDATDPRDQIFALVGLHSTWAAQVGNPPPSVKPDYTKTVIEVYADIVRYLISRPKEPDNGGGLLRVMLRNESYVIKDNYAVEPSSDGDDNFPSWISRWDTCRLTWVGLGYRDCASLWSPSLDSTITIKDIDNPASLTLRGFNVTIIATLEREFEIPTTRLIFDNTLVKETLEKVKLTTSKYVGTDALKEALASNLTTYESKVRGAAVPFNREDLEKYLMYEDHRKEGFHFADSISVGTTFFTSESGHMGIGSRKMQIGDETCVLFGGEILFIVRPVGDYHTLVGECHVHGLMQGEAMEKWKAGELKDQWFDLR